MPVRITYNFRKMAKCMTIEEYHELPEAVQDRYLTWSMEQFLRERAAIELERAGGTVAVARAEALKKVSAFDDPKSMAWNPALYTTWRKIDRIPESQMFSDKASVQEY